MILSVIVMTPTMIIYVYQLRLDIVHNKLIAYTYGIKYLNLALIRVKYCDSATNQEFYKGEIILKTEWKQNESYIMTTKSITKTA